MTLSAPVICVEGVGKCFRLYDQPQDRLKEALLPRVRKVFGLSHASYAHEFWALADISFQVRRGETVGIVGRNGSGKSTLLQIISGTLTPTQGTVSVQGRVAALLELGAGFNIEFTGRENIYLNGALYGLTSAEIAARFEDIAAFADIGRFMDMPVKTYSSGMYVRLAFAVIAHIDADILIIDEALAVGDSLFTQKCMRFLQKFMSHGTVLFVSHDMASVKSLAGRSIWLQDGRIQKIGDTRTIADAYIRDFYGKAQSVDRLAAEQSSADESRAEYEYAMQPSSDLPAAGATITEIKPQEDFRISKSENLQVKNELRVFQFDSAAKGFGDGAATITNVVLRNTANELVFSTQGGECVSLDIYADLHQVLDSPIIGFFLRNRLGLNVFGDNTYITQKDSLRSCSPGDRIVASFCFIMPFLPVGDYSFTAAIASGSNEAHVQHHWIHDACMLKSIASHVHADLFGTPMIHISLECISPSGEAVR